MDPSWPPDPLRDPVPGHCACRSHNLHRDSGTERLLVLLLGAKESGSGWRSGWCPAKAAVGMSKMRSRCAVGCPSEGGKSIEGRDVPA